MTKDKNRDYAPPEEPQQLVFGEDYYFNEAKDWVFTAEYHLRRGYCCGNGCKHCPYDDE